MPVNDAMRNSASRSMGVPLPLIALTVVYFLASLGHFSHNAEFICEYPKLPPWLTSAKVYAAWAAITSVGVLGLLLIRKRSVAMGLLLVAAYAAFGFDGLGHYALAPMALHTLGANVTILSEVAAAALLLAVSLYFLDCGCRAKRRQRFPEAYDVGTRPRRV